MTIFTAVGDTQTMSLEKLSSIREVMTAQMAPDGKRVAYTVTLPRRLYIDPEGEDHRELYVLDRRGNNTPVMTSDVVVGRLRWLNSDNLLFNARRASDKHTALFTYNVDTKTFDTILDMEQDVESFDVSDSRQHIVLWTKSAASQPQQDLKRLGFNAIIHEEQFPAQQLYLASQKDSVWHVTVVPFSGHIIDAQVFNDGQRILLTWSDSPVTESQLLYKHVSVISAQGQELLRVAHTGKLGRVLLSPEQNHVAMIGTNDIADPKEGRLLLASLADGSVSELIPDFAGHVRDISWLSNSRVGFVAHTGVTSLVASKSIRRPGTAFRTLQNNAGIVERMSASASGEDFALVLHRPQHPRELYWQRGVALARATLSNAWLKDTSLAEQTVVQFKAQDELELEGIYVAPLQRSDTPPPLMMVVHGGPEAHISNGWLGKYSHPVHYAASLGFASFFPNYRGSTGRGVDFSQAGQSDYAGAEFNDLLAAKRHLVESGMAKQDQVAITGLSYGGYAAAWAATRFSSEFAASVAGMGISNQVSKFGTSDIPNELVLQHALQWPWQDWLWLLSRSPIYHGANAQTPLLLLHGMRDERVHYSQSLEMYRYLKTQSDVPVRLILYPEARHGFSRVADQYDFSLRLMRWLEHFVLQSKNDLPVLDIGHEQRMEHWRNQLRQRASESGVVASPQ